MRYDDPDDDDFDDADAEAPWEAGEEDDEEPTVPCPFCGREMLEDSPHCPYCEQYVSDADRLRAGRPTWILITAIICLAMAVWWVVGVLF